MWATRHHRLQRLCPKLGLPLGFCWCDFVDRTFFVKEQRDPRNHTNLHEQETDANPSFDTVSSAGGVLFISDISKTPS
jgi:hypothetical protein